MSCYPTLSIADRVPASESAQEHLRMAQRRLKSLGFYGERIDADFGPATDEAVEAFQRSRFNDPKRVDGILGPDTWDELMSDEKSEARLPYGSKVSKAFREKVREVSSRLGIDPAWLMAVMAFETGRSFDPAQKNRAGSSGTGLIQFMSFTARDLGTSTAALARMSAVKQLDYVEKYLRPYRGRMTSLEDTYLAVLYPVAVGKPNGYVLFWKGTLAYKQNRGLDSNGDGKITKWEAAAKVRAELDKGFKNP